jgi:predicted metal-dependent enzyme (double-stranded beta helix superfamily)
MVDDNIDDSLDQLRRTSEMLVEAVSGMADRLQTTQAMAAQLKRQQDAIEAQMVTNRSQRTKNILLGASILFDIVLTIVMALGLIQIGNNSEKINDITTKSVFQQCTEDSLWLAVINERLNRPDDPPTDTERKQIAQYQDVFEGSFRELDCENVLRRNNG